MLGKCLAIAKVQDLFGPNKTFFEIFQNFFFTMATGAELQRLRNGVGLSAKDLSIRIGIDVDRLRKWEQRDQNPRSEDAKKVLDFFGIKKLSDLEKVEQIPDRSYTSVEFNEQNTMSESSREYGSAHQGKNSGGLRMLNRDPDPSRDWQVNKHGNRFEPLSDGSLRVYHHHVSGPVHAAYVAGWGDEDFTNSLPERTSIVKEFSEDLFISFTVTGECQDDNTPAGIVPGMEVTGQSYPRAMWRHKLPFEPPAAKKLKVQVGGVEVGIPNEKKRHRFWIFISPAHGMQIGMIKGQDEEKGILHCCCRNPDKKQYPDFDVRMDECSQIFRIIKRTMND